MSDIENGRSNPSLKRLKHIAKGLETTVSVLLEESQESESLLKQLMAKSEYEELLDYIKDFEEWSESDRKELLKYLKVKKIARNA